MRSEPVNPAQKRAPAARREDDAAAPADAAKQGFEAALRRAGRGLGDETDAQDARPETAAQPLQTAWPTPTLARTEAPATRWAPQAAAAPAALARQLKAQALPDTAGAEPGRWQLQLTETGLPVQRLDLQRSAAGPVTVLVSALNEAQQPRHAARLRERLAARGGARVDFRGPPSEQET